MNQAAKIAFLVKLAGPQWLTEQAAKAVLERAARLGVDPLSVLSARYWLTPERLYERVAEILGLRYSPVIASQLMELPVFVQLEAMRDVRSARGFLGGREVVFAAPGLEEMLALNAQLSGRPDLRENLVLVPPSVLRQALIGSNRTGLVIQAYQGLVRRFPFASAHLELPLGVRIGFVSILAMFTMLALLIPFTQYPLVGGMVAVFLLVPSGFRIWAALDAENNIPLDAKTLLDENDLPHYSVLIPLRDEAHMVPQIVAAIAALDYPREKLEVLFVVESASARTVRAVADALDPAYMELIEVPPGGPATKPKALNFALPLVSGAFVVIFDAEDRPEPIQLRKAASVFATDPGLACLQAQLEIDNENTNFITRMFCTEYAAQFTLLLPALARFGLPLPLGGTSNHFRCSVLRQAGGWDAFNVTEDADLGIRLARMGHKVKAFKARTLEDAPTDFGAWLRQRTRWQKGWMQTLIVHGRRPTSLLRDLGGPGLAAFMTFVGSMVFSIALHGLFLLVVLSQFLWGVIVHQSITLTTTLHIGLLILGYLGAAAAAVIGLNRIGKGDIATVLFGLPIYWVMCWLAIVRAALELVVRPYYWAKTPHTPSRFRPGSTSVYARTRLVTPPMNPRK